MKKTRLIHCLILLFVTCSLAENENTYRAAVLEYSPDFKFSDKAIVRYANSVPAYINYMEKASKNKVDIIVFPEDGLSGLGLPANREKIASFAIEIPDPLRNIVPCKSKLESSILKNLSCAASEFQIYTAVNLVEVLPCYRSDQPKCPSDGVFYYNTNVVFDRQGSIIARYRKFNLFYEPGFDSTEHPEIAIFKTDFGVTFGMFICFDILFKSPAVDLVRERDIHDLIFSTAWFSQLPFLTAVQTQAGWAYANDVTLLASGYNDPVRKSAGSGIYVGKAGSLALTMPLARKNQMLIADVPKYPFMNKYKTKKSPESELPEDSPDNINLYQDDLRMFETKLIPLNEEFQDTVCHGEFCCDFNVYSKNNNVNETNVYRAVAFDGIHQFANVKKSGIQVCGLVSCLNTTLQSCALRKKSFNTGVTFEKIKIDSSDFRQNNHTLMWPAIVNTRLLTYDTLFFQFQRTSDGVELSMNESVDDLLTFGIYLRDYSLDVSLPY